jgi:hypothetical protein
LSSRSRSPERVSFANINEALQLPDLIAIQRDSFQWFLDKGLAEAYHDISPIEDFTGQLSLELEFDPTDPDLRPPPKFSVEECKEKDMTYAAPVFVRARFLNATTGEIKEQTVFMGDFPMMTDRGTFIVNGTERVVVSQLVRSPGVIFQPGRDIKTVFTGTIHPYRGEWIELDIEAKPGKDVTAGCRVARKRRLSLFVLLRARGVPRSLRPSLRLPRRPVGEGAQPHTHAGGGAARDLQAGPSRRAPVGGSGAGVLRKRLLQPEALRPHAGRSLQAESQARPRDRSLVGPLRHRDREARA